MSGKQSKKIRRIKGFSKKAVAGAAFALLCTAPVASEGGEFLLSLYPKFSFPVVKFDESLSTGFGGGLRLTYRPIENINVFVEGDYKQYNFDTKQNIGSLSVVEGIAGAGWHLPITDRLGLDLNAGVGYYHASYAQQTDSKKKKIPVSGINVKAGLGLSYKIGPVISVDAEGGVNHYVLKNTKFLTGVDVAPGITINLTKAFNNKSNVKLGEHNLKPVFPVFYSWYNDNSFGDVEIINNEDSSITDVNVYFYHSQYMNQPQNCGGTKKLGKGEKLVVDLKAFFNEQMLSLNEKTDTMTSIIVEYKYLGAKRSQTFPMVVPVYGRNNMSWEDDRCASAFVSSKDPAAMWFAKYVVSAIRDDVRSGVPQNIQYAMAIFQALDEFGINYVKDPTSAFEDNVGTASIDFLQFPYQTLMYRGGDCDDLSILVCSLFESIGIKTAFITIPGHIYMAFDSGLTLEQAKDYFVSLDELIIDGDEVWVPLEITLSDEGFNRAWTKGSWEWNTAKRNGNAMLYKMTESWQVYKPVNVPGAAAKFNLPEEGLVINDFAGAVDEFVIAQITPQIVHYENLIAKQPVAANYNDFGILYAKYGLFEQAEKQFAIARNKNYLPAVLNSANLYYSKKDYDSAERFYKQVLLRDSKNSLAMIGLARCAYEKNDYKTCDLYYGTVYNTDRALARKYSYLGAFEQTSGRSFSLADRLENTIWLQSSEYTVGKSYVYNNAASGSGVAQSDAVLSEGQPEKNVANTSFGTGAVALAPSGIKNNSEEEDEESAGEGGAGTGSGDGDDGYVGISSQLDFNILTAQDLAMLASEEIEKNGGTLEDFDASSFSLSVQSNTAVVTSVMTDVPVRPAEVVVQEPEPVVVPEVLEGPQEIPASVVPEPVEGLPVESTPVVQASLVTEPEPIVEEPAPVIQEIILETPVVTEPSVEQIVETVTEPVPVHIEEPVVEEEPIVEPIEEPEVVEKTEAVVEKTELAVKEEPVVEVVLREPQEPQVESQEPQIEGPHKNPIGIILAAILGLFGAATGFILGKKRKGK